MSIVFFMALGSRLRQRRKELKKSQQEIADLVGVTQGTIGNMESRDQTKSDYSAKIAEVLGVRLEWLLNGEEPMTASLIPEQTVIAIDDGSDHSDTHRQVQRYDVKLSAGHGTAEWVIRENDDDPIWFRKGWFKAKRLNPDVLKAMYVRGDSMERYLFNYDTVFIDITDVEIADGEVYAIVFKDKFYVKELQSLDGKIKIISHNEKYPPMQTDMSEADNYDNYFQVLGRVVWRGG